VEGTGQPALVIGRPVAEHLEVLGGVPFLGLGIGEGVEQADALHGRQRRAVDHCGFWQRCSLQDSGGDVDDMAELAPQSTLFCDAVRPVNHHAVAGTTEVRGHLLGP
jgi:hypothetical protein